MTSLGNAVMTAYWLTILVIWGACVVAEVRRQRGQRPRRGEWKREQLARRIAELELELGIGDEPVTQPTPGR